MCPSGVLADDQDTIECTSNPCVDNADDDLVCCKAGTSPTKIAGIDPTTIAPGVMTPIKLKGSVAPGDLVKWVKYIGEESCDGVQMGHLHPTEGTDKETSFTIAVSGKYVLCYRAAGKYDAVMQTGVTLTVA